MDSLYSEFRAVDNLVARNSARVLKAFQNARVGSHVSFDYRFLLFGFLVFFGVMYFANCAYLLECG